MQPSYAQHVSGNARRQLCQAAIDDRQPEESLSEHEVKFDCRLFAKRFTENQMDAETFFELAEAFGSEEVGNFLGKDDQHDLLQLVLKANEHPELEPYARPIINRLYTAAYDHKEKEYGNHS